MDTDSENMLLGGQAQKLKNEQISSNNHTSSTKLLIVMLLILVVISFGLSYLIVSMGPKLWAEKSSFIMGYDDSGPGHGVEQYFKDESIPYHYSMIGYLYEFHPNHIQIVKFGRILNDYDVTTIKLTSDSLYSFEDLYDLEYSSNIRVVENSTEREVWRGETFDRVDFKLYPGKVVEKGEPFFYMLKYKVDRLPHLHTPNKIGPDREMHFGLNTGPIRLKVDRKYTILAVPKSSEIIDVFQKTPIKIEEIGEWRLFIYDESNLEERTALHIRFNLTDEDIGSIELNEVLNQLPEQPLQSREDSLGYAA